MHTDSVEYVLLVHPLSSQFDGGELIGSEVFAGYEGLGARERLLLNPFLGDRPRKYFAKDALTAANAILAQANPITVAALPSLRIDETTAALHTLHLINAATTDEPREFDRHDGLRVHRLQSTVFAQYARIAEHVFGALLALLIELDVRSAGKVPNVPHQLRSRWDMASSKRSALGVALTASYSPTVRNAITHGGLKYEPHHVCFQDDNGAIERLNYDDASQIANRLLDTCNGIAAALVKSLAHGLPISRRLSDWAARESAICWARAPLLKIQACYATDRGGGLQAELHGVHLHWHYDALLFDVARAAVSLKTTHPTATRYFLSFQSKEGAPCFFTIAPNDVPELDAPVAALAKLVAVLSGGEHGMVWLEHKRLLPALLSRTPFKHWFNWLDSVDRTSTAVDYELRELRNNSVGWRSRFHAHIVSHPRSADLDDGAVPSATYLQTLFFETALRWLLRETKGRPLGTNRLRIFHCGILHVYCRDERLSRLRGSGLTSNLLFVAQAGHRVGPPLFGSSWQRIGLFHVTVNPNAVELLTRIGCGAG